MLTRQQKKCHQLKNDLFMAIEIWAYQKYKITCLREKMLRKKIQKRRSPTFKLAIGQKSTELNSEEYSFKQRSYSKKPRQRHPQL